MIPTPGPRLAANAIAFLGVFFMLAALIWAMYHYTRPEPPDHARWAERKRILNELRAADREALDHFAWIDQKSGRVRLSMSRSMELTVLEWHDPAAGRSNLLARLERTLPPPPAAAPAQPAAPAPAPVKP